MGGAVRLEAGRGESKRKGSWGKCKSLQERGAADESDSPAVRKTATGTTTHSPQLTLLSLSLAKRSERDESDRVCGRALAVDLRLIKYIERSISNNT